MDRISPRALILVAVAAALLVGAAAYAASSIERDGADDAGRRARVSQRLEIAMLQQATGAVDYFETRAAAALTLRAQGVAQFRSALATARRVDAGSPGLERELGDQAGLAARWQTAVGGQIADLRATGRAPTVAQSEADQVSLRRYQAGYAVYAAGVSRDRAASLASANWWAAGVVAGLTIVLGALGVLAARGAQQRERARVARQAQLRELLQVSGSEAEGRQLLIEHLQRIVPGSGAAVLGVGDAGDDLEVAVGADVTRTPLGTIPTERLRRASCLAVRLGRGFARSDDADGSAPLLRCEICGHVSGSVACEPLLVGGAVIGAVLVGHDGRLRSDQRSAVRESVTQAAPILANQRNLERAEWRAAFDALTGLPNRRAAEAAIRRMVAQAGRTLTPLAAVLIDVDHFKRVNDGHGHERGDAVLARVGEMLAGGVRASDLAARYGGEEFLLLLPDTDRRGAEEVAEKLRRGIEQAVMPAVGPITASFGVAALPEDAVDPAQLLRMADRALYLAKAGGRNRVETMAPEATPDRRDENDLN